MNKLRPNDGPGANGLRGGRNVYSAKTAVGTWLEEYAANSATGYQRGFTTPEFQTEAQHAQLGVITKPIAQFGSGIIPPVRKPQSKDCYKSVDAKLEDTFKSNYRAMTEDLKNKTLLDTTRGAPSCNISRDKLIAYREHWTVDSGISRKLRFQTEANRGNDFLSNKFKVSNVRLLPGTPKTLELMREKVIEKYGILGITVARFHIGTGKQSCNEFLANVKNLGVQLSLAQSNQLLAYFTPTTEIDTEKFMHCFIGHSNSLDDSIPKLILGGRDSVSIEFVIALLDYSTYPEVAEGIKVHLSAYVPRGHVELSKNDLLLLHSDLFASDPLNYSGAVNKIWNL